MSRPAPCGRDGLHMPDDATRAEENTDGEDFSLVVDVIVLWCPWLSRCSRSASSGWLGSSNRRRHTTSPARGVPENKPELIL